MAIILYLNIIPHFNRKTIWAHLSRSVLYQTIREPIRTFRNYIDDIKQSRRVRSIHKYVRTIRQNVTIVSGTRSVIILFSTMAKQRHAAAAHTVHDIRWCL